MAARIIEPKAPVAAASVGVATPKKMTPRTRKKIKPRGRTYLRKPDIFSDKVWCSTS